MAKAHKGDPTLSARISRSSSNEINKMAEKLKCSRSDLVRKLVTDSVSNQYAMKHGGALDKGVIDLSAYEVDRKMMDTLIGVGAGTGAGFIGYKLSQFIRERYTDSEDQGIDLVIGLGLGLLALVGSMDYLAKAKK